MLIASTGYTGEQGIELMAPHDDCLAFWEHCMQRGVQPCGLGARDTLRLEAGMHLYGQDIDDKVHPLESNLGWTIAWDPPERDFIGKQALAALKEQGVKTRLFGIILSERGVLRRGMQVSFEDAAIASASYAITSHIFLPPVIN